MLSNFCAYASVSQMLTNLITGQRLITAEHAQQKVVMIFKTVLVKHLIDIPASSYLSPAPTVHNTRGHNRRFSQSMLLPMKMARVDFYLLAFIFSILIKIWNSLPQYVIDSENTDQFKLRLTGLATLIH